METPERGKRVTEERQGAVFLDRDGTINEEVGYLDSLEKLKLIPGAAEAIRLINKSGMRAVVITNQSGVARGFFDESFVEAVHARLAGMLHEENAFLDSIYFCPHHPTDGLGKYLQTCVCRKPAPGLLVRAVEELRLDTTRSYMVGDTLKDIEAGARAGIKGILVRTGYGETEEKALSGVGCDAQSGVAAIWPVHIARNLLDAVKWILGERKP